MSKAEAYFAEDGMLSKVFEGYTVREEQQEFSEKIHEAIDNQVSMLGEANTGVGKSLAALTGAATIIEKTGKPVIIVTSSILLQEQYMEKDIPILSKATDYEYGEVLAKGKSNYLCMDKALSVKPSKFGPESQEEVNEILKWMTQTKTGSTSELSFEPKGLVRQNFVITEENECKGKTCPVYEKCFYYQNQKKILTSKLIICNYHYFFLGLNLPNMLPNDIGAVIFDEFHEVVGIARDILEYKFHNNDFDSMNKLLARTQTKIQDEDNPYGVYLDFAEIAELPTFLALKEKFHNELTEFFIKNKGEKEKIVIEKSFIEPFKEIAIGYQKTLKEFSDNISYWLDDIVGVNYERLSEGGYDEHHTEWLNTIIRYKDFVDNKQVELKEMLDFKEDAKRLIWLELPQSKQYVNLISKPFDVTDLLYPIFTTGPNRLESLGSSISVGMSATLTTGNSFDHFKKQVGLEKESVVESIVNSPFDMENNMLWYLPEGAPEGNVPGHNVFVLDQMEKFIRELNGKVMCLFTSTYHMNQAANHFNKLFSGTGIEILKQGDLPKKAIVEKMRAQDNVVIVGTRSFFTGVDIQGPNLKAVLIDKLPFPMIGDPINEYLMNQDRGFFRYSLPESIITLKQGFGRLIRTSEDKGVVSVLDGRLSTKNYKNRVFNSFSFKTKGTRSFEEAINFAKGE